MKKTLTILIATYEAEDRIEAILSDLKRQVSPKNCSIQIIVHVDKGMDNTFAIAKQSSNQNVSVTKGLSRLGFGGVVKKYITENKSDYLLILNDDIRINDTNFILNIFKFTSKKPNGGLFCTNIIPEKGNFIQMANTSSFTAYRKMAISIKSGDNIFTCDGKVLVLSKSFMKKMQFPESISEMGNVDSFLYFSCLENGYNYHYIKTASVSFVFPSDLKDYIKWTARNNSNAHLLTERFGNIVKKSYTLPNSAFKFMLIEAFRNPFGALFIFVMRFYIRILALRYSSNFNPKWDTIKSSKKIALN